MEKMQLNLAVVTVNWQRALDTIECVSSLLKCNVPINHIFIIDNGSTDDSISLLRSNFPDGNIIALDKNYGFTGGYNFGIQHALTNRYSRYSHIFLINNDTVAEHNSIHALLESPWDIAIPKIVFYNEPNHIWAAGCRLRRIPPSISYIGHNKLDSPTFNIPYPLDYATGCALMVKRVVFEKIGGFDTIYESYYEDYDFCHRVRQVGYTIGYVPQSKILHKVSRSLGEYSPHRWQLIGRNLVIFYRKDNRFPWRSLCIYLVWISIREIILGHVRILPVFFKGVREGLKLITQDEVT